MKNHKKVNKLTNVKITKLIFIDVNKNSYFLLKYLVRKIFILKFDWLIWNKPKWVAFELIGNQIIYLCLRPIQALNYKNNNSSQQ